MSRFTVPAPAPPAASSSISLPYLLRAQYIVDQEQLDSTMKSFAPKSDFAKFVDEANGKFLNQTDAKNTYLSQVDARNTYLTQDSAKGTYQPLGNYVVRSDLAPFLNSDQIKSTYLSQADANKTYLNQSDASKTFQKTGDYALKSDLAPFITSDLAQKIYLSQADAEKSYQKAGNYLTPDQAKTLYATRSDLAPFLTQDSASKTFLSQDAGKTFQKAGDYALRSEIPNLSGYARVTDIPKIDTSSFAKVTDLQTLKATIAPPDTSNFVLKNDLASYARVSDIPKLIPAAQDMSKYALRSEIPIVPSNVALKSEIPSTTNFALKNEIPSLVGYATTKQLDSFLQKTDVPATLSPFLANYPTKKEVDSQYLDKKDLSGVLSNYPTKKEVDSQYLDKKDVTGMLSTFMVNYPTKKEVDSTYLDKKDVSGMLASYLPRSDASNFATKANSMWCSADGSVCNTPSGVNVTKSFKNTADKDSSEISNDMGSFKQLMLVGNSSGGTRKVGVWDTLDVNGALNVKGKTAFNDDLVLNNQPIVLRAATDGNHQIVYSTDVDGPMVAGCGGGKLYSTCGKTTALTWDKAGNVTVGGKINSSQFRSTQLYKDEPINAGAPQANFTSPAKQFTSGGGVLQFVGSVSGYWSAGNYRTWSFRIDGVVRHTKRFFFNTNNVHQSTPVSFLVTGLPPGTHNLSVSFDGTVDSNDFYDLVVTEFPI